MDSAYLAPNYFLARVALHQNLVAKVARAIDSLGDVAVTEYGLLILIDAAMCWPTSLCHAPDAAFARHAAAMMRNAMLQARGRHVATRQP